jgi:hypothetical protein
MTLKAHAPAPSLGSEFSELDDLLKMLKSWPMQSVVRTIGREPTLTLMSPIATYEFVPVRDGVFEVRRVVSNPRPPATGQENYPRHIR